MIKEVRKDKILRRSIRGVRATMISENEERNTRLIRYGSILLVIQNILLILAFFILPFLLLGLKEDAIMSSASVLILSIDIPGMVFLGKGIYDIRKGRKTVKKNSFALLVLVTSWICMTLISRCSLLFYCLNIERWDTNGYSFLERLPLVGDRFNYVLNDFLYLSTWTISLILLVLLAFKLGRFVSSVNEKINVLWFNFYSVLNLISLTILVILIFTEPFGIFIMEGNFPWSWQLNMIFFCFYFLKFLIIPIVGVFIFNKLRRIMFF
ncbi:MAG: hypothetical protein ACFFAJ_18180 [Candidatus Hodarchaeota archaeon]